MRVTSASVTPFIVAALAFLIGGTAACGSTTAPRQTDAVPRTQPTSPQTGKAGERWGGFIFMDPASPVPFTTTPRASGPVPDEESIPSSYPGTRVFRSLNELVASELLPASDMLVPAASPAGYEFEGAYVVALDNGKVVDYSLSYRHAGTRYAGPAAMAVFAPDLSIGWTSRAPEPLPAETEGTALGLGRKALPRVKVHVRGYEGVFAEVTNPDSIAPDLVVLSSVNWFDTDGRLWYVQAAESLDAMLQLADSLKEPG